MTTDPLREALERFDAMDARLRQEGPPALDDRLPLIGVVEAMVIRRLLALEAKLHEATQ